MSTDQYIAITGGVGGAKLALGLANILQAGQLAIMVNTADDFQHLGLHISPDLDTLLYTLADENNKKTGWGRRDETWQFMHALEKLGGETWFQLGDRDLATNIERTNRLANGQSLSEVTMAFANAFGIKHAILPMSNDKIQTKVQSDQGVMDFQHYFVREQCEPKISAIRFAGSDAAQINPEILTWLSSPNLAGIILCPSNPFLSIDPILSIPGMREALASSPAPVIAVSPIVGGNAIKGPTAKIMRELSLPVTATQVAKYYADFLDYFLLDTQDGSHQAEISELNIGVASTNIIMKSLQDKIRVAEACIQLLESKIK